MRRIDRAGVARFIFCCSDPGLAKTAFAADGGTESEDEEEGAQESDEDRERLVFAAV